MKSIYVMALAGLLCLAAPAAMAATSASGVGATTIRVLPVLVKVDAHGRVTSVSPSVQLRPRLQRVLHATLDKMITKPASAHGHPVSSQFIIKLALQATPRQHGGYDAHFAYVSATPLPAGNAWYWRHEYGEPLAIASRNLFPSPRGMRMHDRGGAYGAPRAETSFARTVPRQSGAVSQQASPRSNGSFNK